MAKAHLLAAVLAAWALPTSAQNQLREPYQLQQMDMHLHAGLELETPLDRWLDAAAADGRRVVVLLDHLELYRKTAAEYRDWLLQRPAFVTRYPMGPAGRQALMRDFAKAREHRGLTVFTAWEVSEDELDTGTEMDVLAQVDLVGWHISPRNGKQPPDGKHLIRRASQLRELQQKLPVPMILFHPFTMRVENLERTAQREGRPISSITTAQYRFFQPGEQRELADLLRGRSIYIEIARESAHCMENPACREAMIADIQPLAELGVRFTVSTDAHGLRHAQLPFRPESYCKPLGVTPANTNPLVQELLARRPRPAAPRTP
ncbi:MAG: hypothetical protein HY821_07235 [Acidobacteria bacterium]|nr:hypothetical protein [Acidobacteriota bacterium]